MARAIGLDRPVAVSHTRSQMEHMYGNGPVVALLRSAFIVLVIGGCTSSNGDSLGDDSEALTVTSQCFQSGSTVLSEMTVNTDQDAKNSTASDLACTTPAGCTLRAALVSAVNQGLADAGATGIRVIKFAPTVTQINMANLGAIAINAMPSNQAICVDGGGTTVSPSVTLNLSGYTTALTQGSGHLAITNSNLALRGLGLQGATQGSAISFKSTGSTAYTLHLQNIVCENNTTPFQGGCLYAESIGAAAARVTYSAIYGRFEFNLNKAAQRGGAIALNQATLEYLVPSSTQRRGATVFQKNQALSGGAISAEGAKSSIKLKHSQFYDNWSRVVKTSVPNSSFPSWGSGGAVAIVSSAQDNTIEASTLSRNGSAYNGGAISLFDTPLVTVKSVNFQLNVAKDGGALSYLRQQNSTPKLQFIGSTFSANQATGVASFDMALGGFPVDDVTWFTGQMTYLRQAIVMPTSNPQDAFINQAFYSDATKTGNGGAIYFQSASAVSGASLTPSVTLDSSTFVLNAAHVGGAIKSNTMVLSIHNNSTATYCTFETACSFTRNFSMRSQGAAIHLVGVYNQSTTVPLFVKDGVFLYNDSNSYAGAIYSRYGAINITGNSQFNLNKGTKTDGTEYDQTITTQGVVASSVNIATSVSILPVTSGQTIAL